VKKIGRLVGILPHYTGKKSTRRTKVLSPLMAEVEKDGHFSCSTCSAGFTEKPLRPIEG
jgi:hypothetical protein